MQAKQRIVDALKQSIESINSELSVLDSQQINDIKFEIIEIKDARLGDLSTNCAFKLCKLFKMSPMTLSRLWVEHLLKNSSDDFKSIEACEPGFINFFLKKEDFYQVLDRVLDQKETYGFNRKNAKNQKIILEYVSANPTGPLTLAHARQAIVGDVLANILESVGYEVFREYYLNDRGLQIETLGYSIYLRYLELNKNEIEFPDDCYQGDYIKILAQEILDKDQSRWVDQWENSETKEYFSNFGKNTIMDEIKTSLSIARVPFDQFFSEEAFSKTDAISKVLTRLEKDGHLYQQDGATWFKATNFKDDKDRVLIRSNGQMTYITPDIAYHLNKLERKFHQIINIWGPDHHGYIPRIRAAIEALGYPPECLNVIILQLSTLYEGDKKLSMSTRKGEFITQDQVLEEVGVDAARFFFCMRTTDAHLDFDLQLAKDQSSENPVYYIQYAHARICSIQNQAIEKGILMDQLPSHINWDLLIEEEEKEIIKLMQSFPDILTRAAEVYQPCKLTEYLKELAKSFHSYYNKYKVIGDDISLSYTRLGFVLAIRQVLKNALQLLRIDAPEKM